MVNQEIVFPSLGETIAYYLLPVFQPLQRFLSVVESERPPEVIVIESVEPRHCFLTCSRQETLFRAIAKLSCGWPRPIICDPETSSPARERCPPNVGQMAKFSFFSVKLFHRQNTPSRNLCINRHCMAPSGPYRGQQLPRKNREASNENQYFARTVESADNRASGGPKLFRVAPKHEQFLPEFVASLRPRWSHQASMARRSCRRPTPNGENHETA
jgi:hypothetical protein